MSPLSHALCLSLSLFSVLVFEYQMLKKKKRMYIFY